MSFLEVVKWPLAVIVIFVIGVISFRISITNLIDRLRRVGIGKLGLETSPGPQSGAVEIRISPAEELLQTLDSALLREQETLIRNDLDGRRIEGAAERERVLVRFLAASQLALAAEITYGMIWGSQIAVLQFLNQVASGIEAQGIRPFYDQAAGLWPTFYQGYSFEQWLGFLENNILVARTGGLITISVRGREFLQYLVARGHPLTKAG